ncbi:MAG: nitrilase-related carbon-nitrogen hydrolase [Anaerolineales bacterium]|jgi:apolipoprotein N-acyltransferase
MNTNQITYPQKDRWSYLWLAIGTLMLFLWRVPLVWWLSPVFLLRFIRTQKVRRGFLLIWLALFLANIPPMYSILNTLIPMPMPVFLIVTAVIVLMIWVIPYVVDRLLAPRLQGFAATLVFPLTMTVMSYISAKANPMGSIGGAAYFQYSNLALLQLLSITGMWGIVFLVNWFGPVVNYAWERGFAWKEIRRNTLTYAAIMLAVLLYGGARLAYAPQATHTVRMHGITAVDMREEMLPKLHEAQKQDWQAYRQISMGVQDLYLAGAVREARAGAQIVHWPEMGVILAKEDENSFIDRAKQIAQDESIYLVMAYDANYQDGRPFENKLLIVDPAGQVVLEHYKFGVAQLDGSVVGDGILHTVETPLGTLSGILCNDTDHEEIIAQAGKNGTDILFSPSLEWRAIDPIHAHMAMFRAIENGVTLVRQADNGLSLVVDPYGRVPAAMDHFNDVERVMVAQVPILSAFTIYPYIGDLFAWLAMAGLVGITIWAVVSKKAQ